MFQHSYSVWKSADKPNYRTNIDLVYPYSEFPHEGDYNLLKIPVPPKDFIQHVDYWGEGRVVTADGVSGFPNSYNINHQFRLVSKGPDRGKKIPNRIPVFRYTYCDTSSYIKDNSVLIVTVSAASINRNCAKDIARIVNDEHGKVVVYKGHGDSPDMSELADVLKIKGLLISEDAILPNELIIILTYFHSHVVFEKISKVEEIKIETRKENLLNHIDTGNFDAAVHLSKDGEIVSEIVTKLTSSAPDKVMFYAYKLWESGSKDIVRKYFPKPYELVVNRDWVHIINKQYGLKLRADPNHSESVITKNEVIVGEGEKSDHPSAWKFYPMKHKDGLAFVIHNNNCMKMVGAETENGDPLCWAAEVVLESFFSPEYFFLLEPSVEGNGDVVFAIINVMHKKGLKLDTEEGAEKNRRLWGHNGNIREVNDNFKWIVKKVPPEDIKQK